MNVLFEQFPDTVEVDGKEYAVVTDFREWIKLYEFFEHTLRFNRKDLELILDWFEDARPPDEVKAIRALQDFMLAEDIMDNMDEEDEEDEEDGDEVSRRRPGKPSFSFSQDAICIYAAFRAVYGIDLTNIPYMHWWQFLSLLAGLPQDTEIKERIYYRSVDLNTIKSKEERDRIKKIKKLIAIKEPQRRVVDDYEIGDVFA